jgi:hypothetical protein
MRSTTSPTRYVWLKKNLNTKSKQFEKKFVFPTLFAAYAFYNVANMVRLFKKKFKQKKVPIYSTPFWPLRSAALPTRYTLT